MDTQIRNCQSGQGANVQPSKRLRAFGLTVSGIRRWIIFQPLAVAMAILVALPILSWQQPNRGKGSPFQASAATTVCPPNPANLIIQNTCPAGVLFDTNGDLTQLESDAVNAYLGLHELPPTDASVVYSFGRQDLRDAIRAGMIAQMLAIIKKPASLRTQHEQVLFGWLQGLVQQNEVALYTDAIAEANRFFGDPCTFTLDADIANAYSLHYNGYPFCGAQQSAIFGAPIPAASYFTAFGLKNSYGAAAQTFSDFGSLMADTSISLGEQAGIALAAGAVVSGVVGAAIFANLSEALTAFATTTATSGPETIAGASTSVFIVSGSTVDSIGLGTLVAAPVAIILITITAGVFAALELSTNAQNQNDIANLGNLLSQAQNNPPDLASMAADTSGLGLYKIQATMNSQTVPEMASGAVLPAHRPGTDLDFAIDGAITSNLSYQDWDGNNWTAQTWGGWFVETCTTVNQSAKCLVADSINANIRYVDAAGLKWTGSRIGGNFVNTKASPLPTNLICAADEKTGLTPASTDLSTCASYVSDHLTLKDANGNVVTAAFSTLAPPVVSGSTTLAFGPGIPSTQTITVIGNPTPAVCLSSGSLTADFSLNGGNCGSGTFSIQFDGSLSTPTANHTITLSATNSVGTISIPVAIDVSPQLAIISSNTVGGRAGFPVNFLVVATGVPTPTLSLQNIDISDLGLTFKDNGNGTATISGVPKQADSDFMLKGSGVVATNSQGSVEQDLILNFTPAPNATLAPPSSANFIAGVANQVLLSSTGAVTPVSWSLDPNPPPPSWLSLQDNGDGTALLKGTPPLLTVGAFNIGLGLGTVGEALGVDATYTVNVQPTPVFLSPNTATFTVGSNGAFTPSNAEGAFITLVGDLPSGLTFSNLGGSALISGAPAVGTGGQYTVDLMASVGTLFTATQILTINVNEALQIDGPNWANFYVGQANSVAISATGFPLLSSAPLSQQKTAPNFVLGAQFTVTGLPASLQSSNLNPAGENTGTLTLSGTPLKSDLGPALMHFAHQLTITGSNGVGSPSTLNFTLNIAVPGDVNGDGVANCTDLSLVQAALGSSRGMPGYNAAADINNDGVINVIDLSAVSRNLSKGLLCH